MVFNVTILKFCMRKETFPSDYFSYLELNEYLKTLPAEGFFYFNLKENMVEYLIDHPDWIEHFYGREKLLRKETM